MKERFEKKKKIYRKMLDIFCCMKYDSQAHEKCADVAELADALDSGSSGHCARAGSSPVIRSHCGKTAVSKDAAVFLRFLHRYIRKNSFA